jgi:hypothetical protein
VTRLARVGEDGSAWGRGYTAECRFHFTLEDFDPVFVGDLKVIPALLLAAAHGNINLFISLILSRQMRTGLLVG